MAVFKCKMCGGNLEISSGNETVGVCEYCGTKQTLPKLNSEERINLYDRASHFRRNNEYDKAANIYEQILNADSSDAEAYWSLVLCCYGIEYVEDPETHKRVPTVNRAQFTSIYDDANYQSAIRYADAHQRPLYEEEAKVINDIQKGILAISQQEDPFDVFICYKETDQDGRRTRDSVLAADLYHQLVQEGFKVFFSRITLEDKIGTAYEPYIFAALNSAKVMVALATKPEYYRAVWVKNEWSRYLALVKKSAGKKILVPAYKDMDPYDIPEEFSHLQALDMSKLGFMQDLIRGIKKVIRTDEPKIIANEAKIATAGNANTEALLKRAFIFLEDGDWQKADEFCEQVLNNAPENAVAYVGKLLAELHISKRGDLANCTDSFEQSSNYIKAIRFGDDEIKNELEGYIECIHNRKEIARREDIYNNAVGRMNRANDENSFRMAMDLFRSIPGYKESDQLLEQCSEKMEISRKNTRYSNAISKMREGTVKGYETAIELFGLVQGWKDADEQIPICREELRKLKEKQEKERAEEEDRQNQKREKKSKQKKLIPILVISAIAIIAIVITILVKVLDHKCGKHLWWKYDKSTQTLTIYGTGDMYDDNSLVGAPGSIRAVIIQDGCTTIGDGAFVCCSKMESITIPNSVTKIKDHAFFGCSALKEIIVDENNPYFAVEDGVLFDNKKEELWLYTPGKEESIYEVPDTVKRIEEEAFRGIWHLDRLELPNTIEEIGDRAFRNSSFEIYYMGTIEQWISYNYDSEGKVIHCLDGDYGEVVE